MNENIKMLVINKSQKWVNPDKERLAYERFIQLGNLSIPRKNLLLDAEYLYPHATKKVDGFSRPLVFPMIAHGKHLLEYFGQALKLKRVKLKSALGYSQSFYIMVRSALNFSFIVNRLNWTNAEWVSKEKPNDPVQPPAQEKPD